MRSTMPSPNPIHDRWRPSSCECNDCMSKEFQKSTPYWTSGSSMYAMDTTSEHSTNSTVSNLPGPGRTLDHYLGILGRRFHTFAGEVAHDLGYGPIATTTRVESRVVKFDAESNRDKREKYWKKIVRDCRKLIKYMQTCASSTFIYFRNS